MAEAEGLISQRLANLLPLPQSGRG
jgi:hypothetical protein